MTMVPIVAGDNLGDACNEFGDMEELLMAEGGAEIGWGRWDT